jgi:hypothetical protein
MNLMLINILEWMKEYLPLTAVFGGLWIGFTYLQDKRQAEVARSIEARKPFLGRQLDLYFDAAKVAGVLATTNRLTPIWENMRERFEQLFWTELSLVEDDNVKDAMEKFKGGLLKLAQADEQAQQEDGHENVAEKEAELRSLARNLALQIKRSLQSSWVVGSGVTIKNSKTLKRWWN